MKLNSCKAGCDSFPSKQDCIWPVSPFNYPASTSWSRPSSPVFPKLSDCYQKCCSILPSLLSLLLFTHSLTVFPLFFHCTPYCDCRLHLCPDNGHEVTSTSDILYCDWYLIDTQLIFWGWLHKQMASAFTEYLFLDHCAEEKKQRKAQIPSKNPPPCTHNPSVAK